MTGDELHLFFEDFVSELHNRGVVCAITSGLACVHYGIAETTKDCDLLCHPSSFSTLLDFLDETKISGADCHYRGNISPPLNARWHRGGWTSHFQWDSKPEVTTLDVFGHALRESSPWFDEVSGKYASETIVAEMKRTDRDKDWPFIDLLGTMMLNRGDERGWLHLFEPEKISAMLLEYKIPEKILQLRPALRLAGEGNPLLRGALRAERQFWQELDRLRIRICRAALRPFVSQMGKTSTDGTLSQQHASRLCCAEKFLEPNPIGKHGVGRFIEEAREATAVLINPNLLQWLPDVRPHFRMYNE